jgi:hypothetical protein
MAAATTLAFFAAIIATAGHIEISSYGGSARLVYMG